MGSHRAAYSQVKNTILFTYLLCCLGGAYKGLVVVVVVVATLSSAKISSCSKNSSISTVPRKPML